MLQNLLASATYSQAASSAAAAVGPVTLPQAGLSNNSVMGDVSELLLQNLNCLSIMDSHSPVLSSGIAGGPMVGSPPAGTATCASGGLMSSPAGCGWIGGVGGPGGGIATLCQTAGGSSNVSDSFTAGGGAAGGLLVSSAGGGVLHASNWRCESCSNINYPRRIKCKRCGLPKGVNATAAGAAAAAADAVGVAMATGAGAMGITAQHLEGSGTSANGVVGGMCGAGGLTAAGQASLAQPHQLQQHQQHPPPPPPPFAGSPGGLGSAGGPPQQPLTHLSYMGLGGTTGGNDLTTAAMAAANLAVGGNPQAAAYNTHQETGETTLPSLSLLNYAAAANNAAAAAAVYGGGLSDNPMVQASQFHAGGGGRTAGSLIGNTANLSAGGGLVGSSLYGMPGINGGRLSHGGYGHTAASGSANMFGDQCLAAGGIAGIIGADSTALQAQLLQQQHQVVGQYSGTSGNIGLTGGLVNSAGAAIGGSGGMLTLSQAAQQLMNGTTLLASSPSLVGARGGSHTAGGGGVGGAVVASGGQHQQSAPRVLQAASCDEDLAVGSTLQMMLLKAKDVADRLMQDFQNMGDAEPTSNAVEVLKTSLAMLGHQCDTTTTRSVNVEDSPVQGVGGPHFSAPTMLAHPDEFKNPSSFLKIYGDPLCGSSGGNNPIKGQHGNWVCSKCQNVNFPRRFRCNKCAEYRDAEGDDIVSEYAKTVYHQHLRSYKALALKQGIDIPLKRFNNASPLSNNGATPTELLSAGMTPLSASTSPSMHTPTSVNHSIGFPSSAQLSTLMAPPAGSSVAASNGLSPQQTVSIPTNVHSKPLLPSMHRQQKFTSGGPTLNSPNGAPQATLGASVLLNGASNERGIVAWLANTTASDTANNTAAAAPGGGGSTAAAMVTGGASTAGTVAVPAKTPNSREADITSVGGSQVEVAPIGAGGARQN